MRATTMRIRCTSTVVIVITSSGIFIINVIITRRTVVLIYLMLMGYLFCVFLCVSGVPSYGDCFCEEGIPFNMGGYVFLGGC